MMGLEFRALDTSGRGLTGLGLRVTWEVMGAGAICAGTLL